MRKLFIPYIMGNHEMIENIKLLSESGADYVEVGIPFSDPVADGEIIMSAGKRAIEEGITASYIMNELKTHKHMINTPYIIMTYYNIIESYGVEKFIYDANEAGVYGLIIPDLPLELGLKLKQILSKVDLKLISIVAMTTSDDRLKMISEQAEGFIYTVTMNRTTGENSEFHKDLLEKLKYIKSFSNIPIVCGFGIKNKSQIESLIPYCDGVIIGSEIVRRLEMDSRKITERYLKDIRQVIE